MDNFTPESLFLTLLPIAQYLSFGCSDVTFSRYGPYWRQARKICVSELLSHKRVNSFRLVRSEEMNRMLTHLSSSGSDDPVDMSKVFFTLANDILCRVAFGRRFIKKEGQNRHLTGVLTEAQELFGGFCAGDFYPEWQYWVDWVTGFKKRLEKNLEDLREVCEEIIQEHVERSTDRISSTNGEDFVDVLLRVQQREDLEVPITDDNLKALVLDMFVAGTDTTSAVLEWTMTELVRHPRVMKKAQEEVRKIVGSTGKVDESHLQHLHYMKAVVKETMRLHPPVPLLVPRESMEDCVLDGYEIPAKTRVLINSYAIGRDPKSWEDPLNYDPERFENHNMDFKDQDFKFLPFGGGRRGCPGYAFGLATMELALALLLYHFDWELPQGVGADDVNLDEIFGLATRKKTPLILVPTANKDYKF
ncbi:Cytochrome P450 71A1 [Morus notabilis]|uniref:Cytochrome P450 71A1 n=1 Tax=Morus notabilis TaxID=981085 RepID=W9RMU2_9ROSA|nr:Cytochrome P450 71A1 [Morus notabilis]